jgi:Protein of unknown function (DUF1391)
MKRKVLRHRYGRAGSSFGMTSHDLGNNESYGIGISYNGGQSNPYLALTGTQSKWFKTLGGATRWLAKRGYDAHGKRVRP